MNRTATPSTCPVPNDRGLRTPLNSFPVELLDVILGLVVKNLLKSIPKDAVGRVLRQYRALILTCRMFNFVLDNASVRVFVHETYRYSPTGPEVLFLNPQTPFTPDHPKILTNWPSVFKEIQRLSVRHTEIRNVNSHAMALGKFWLNPTVTLDDIDLYHYVPYNTNFILCLGPLFDRNKRRLKEDEREQIPRVPSPYRVGEMVNVITSRNNQVRFYSVRTWGANHTDHRRPNWTSTLSSSMVAVQVSEWWVWKRSSFYSQGTYMLGYYRENGWVVHLESGAIYTNWPKRPWR